ncbi:adenylosuccinate lyase [Aestuariivivens sediminis]|uniref:adenylosuccinate lyase n=1 Tax=Aestuariivivens sediminis TaxID=2913557 RepID=UPI001F58B1B4|nr:adenylosuccinate lyase [Aestuariivivens sediminis]
MNTAELIKELNDVNGSRQKRLKCAQLVLNDLTLLPKLIDIIALVDNKISCRAAWVLEMVCNEYIYAIAPYLDTFCSSLNKVHLNGAVRAVSKICELIAKTNDSGPSNPLKKALKPLHKELIIETCFDWMIKDQKVATKVHAMETLYLLGKGSHWIHKELSIIIVRDFQTQSAGFKARAKQVLKKLKN